MSTADRATGGAAAVVIREGGHAAAAVRPMLDRRAAAAWSDSEATGTAEADHKEFTEALHRPHWTHAYPPQLFTADAVDELADLGVRLAELISAFPRRVFGDDLAAWARYLGVPDADAALVLDALRSPRLARVATAFMRPDLVVTEEGPKLVELNVAASLGGLSTCAPYAAATRRSAYARFLRERGLRVDAPDTSRVWLDVFGSLVERHGPGPLHVFEATADPADLDSGRRFFVDMASSDGHDVSCGLVHDLELTDAGAFFEGRRVDAVFTAYTWHETREFVPSALTRRLMALDAARKVDFIGSPAAALHDNKANLALLFEDEAAALLTPQERDLVARHVPETFRLRPDTLPRACASRAELLCKPASAYGGKGMAYGFTMDDVEWHTVLEERLANPDERYVLQRRVPPAVVALPGTDPSAREMVLAPLVFGGRFAGTFVRQAPPRTKLANNASSGSEAAALLCLRD